MQRQQAAVVFTAWTLALRIQTAIRKTLMTLSQLVQERRHFYSISVAGIDQLQPPQWRS